MLINSRALWNESFGIQGSAIFTAGFEVIEAALARETC